MLGITIVVTVFLMSIYGLTPNISQLPIWGSVFKPKFTELMVMMSGWAGYGVLLFVWADVKYVANILISVLTKFIPLINKSWLDSLSLL
jgi:hypothetical protein